jgi:hypothetical protein
MTLGDSDDDGHAIRSLALIFFGVTAYGAHSLTEINGRRL